VVLPLEHVARNPKNKVSSTTWVRENLAGSTAPEHGGILNGTTAVETGLARRRHQHRRVR
jgi:hypothetical protein